ncbi:hypothetical protein T11_5102 [Trichinella zimbabwensis]|uniref:Uncharacterized protein n=1 Tax=Trichinella zimbabwensis TaxID=268475 RepID=A0A0V1DKZ7_9BILA|nr:hypothetical protein T11_5102 [Trichinella zimbabwensis]
MPTLKAIYSTTTGQFGVKLSKILSFINLKV